MAAGLRCFYNGGIFMKKLLLFLLVPALFAACNMEVGDYKYFDYTLRGNWETTVYPYHKLAITLDTIEITAALYYNDVPGLAGYTKNVTLSGYSEKLSSSYPDHQGSLSIKDKGIWQPAVPYVFWKAGTADMLTIGSGSQETTFQKQ
jgi:hypothetical protein